MMSSNAFFKWRKSSRAAAVDFRIFVKNKMETDVLIKTGWVEKTLLELFRFDFELCSLDQNDSCMKCSDILYCNCVVELFWLDTLERIKSGGYNDSEIVVDASVVDANGQPKKDDKLAKLYEGYNYEDKSFQKASDQERSEVCNGNSEEPDVAGMQNTCLEDEGIDELEIILCWHCWDFNLLADIPPVILYLN
ncbi:hypothetical protein B0O99DRAFT_736004 [Bisporella sp. PMI_857]|nr:hypothetical protein B0O99DRAFT_736004 [Bisporella sp. PMI_857]